MPGFTVGVGDGDGEGLGEGVGDGPGPESVTTVMVVALTALRRSCPPLATTLVSVVEPGVYINDRGTLEEIAPPRISKVAMVAASV